MSTFDTLFFEQHINEDEKIEKVFHRHIFVMIEDLIIWIFFALIIPSFLYYYNVFDIKKIIIDTSYVHAYLFLLYFILLYKIFDWYLDVWIATNATLVEMRWKWFTPQLMYINYEKIESIEVRTKSWLYSVVSISDVRVHMAGDETHTLSSAAFPKDVVQFLQEKTKPKKVENTENEDKRESFEIMVDTLSGIVKNHLNTPKGESITRDYVEKLDETLQSGIPIDLRSLDEKEYINDWKKRNFPAGKIEKNLQ